MSYKTRSRASPSSNNKDANEINDSKVEIKEDKIPQSCSEKVILQNVKKELNYETKKKIQYISTNSSILPFNAPEKIIIVFDRACDEMFTDFESTAGEKQTPTSTLKKALKFFLHNKSFINHKHEFALMVLNENIGTWMVDFTSDIKEVLNALENIEECETEDLFDMNSVFETIMKNVALPKTQDLQQPPPFVIRTLFLYNRSYTIPECNVSEEMKAYFKSPYFTFDVLITHEVPGTNNHCRKIIDILRNYDDKEKSYFFPVARDALLLHQSMAKLLCHPLQRQKQDFAKYVYITA